MTTIKLTYRYIINASSAVAFDRNVLRFSYMEFLLKSQVYNLEQQFKTFTVLKANDGRANSLHYKCGFAVSGFIEELKNKIPLLQDNLGKPVAFENYNFEVIETDITDEEQHKVAIHFTTAELLLHNVIGNNLILSEKRNETNSMHETFTLMMQPDLSIVYYENKIN